MPRCPHLLSLMGQWIRRHGRRDSSPSLRVLGLIITIDSVFSMLWPDFKCSTRGPACTCSPTPTVTRTQTSYMPSTTSADRHLNYITGENITSIHIGAQNLQEGNQILWLAQGDAGLQAVEVCLSGERAGVFTSHVVT